MTDYVLSRSKGREPTLSIPRTESSPRHQRHSSASQTRSSIFSLNSATRYRYTGDIVDRLIAKKKEKGKKKRKRKDRNEKKNNKCYERKEEKRKKIGLAPGMRQSSRYDSISLRYRRVRLISWKRISDKLSFSSCTHAAIKVMTHRDKRRDGR